MSEKPANDDRKKEDAPKEKGATFDMYHFFSRKDVILAGLLILALLLYVLFRFGMGTHAV